MTTGTSTAILWLRQDLRLGDNPALRACCTRGSKLAIVFIDDPAEQTLSTLGAASRVWLHHSLQSLDQDLKQRGQRLLYMQGDSYRVLKLLVEELDAGFVAWNRCYEPASLARDTKIKKAIGELTEVESFNGVLHAEPWEVLKGDGTPYRVYTPFYRRVAVDFPPAKPLATPKSLPQVISQATIKKLPDPASVHTLDDLKMLPALDWHIGMMRSWSVGEAAARKTLKAFLQQRMDDYGEGRNLPAKMGTSRLSPHLHFGEISPRQILHRIFRSTGGKLESGSGAEVFAKEVIWREFAYHLLYHFPDTVEQPMDKRFARFPWPALKADHLERWQRGLTGVPIVDAGMRELWQTGWMHNRVRMIVASYLIKNLMIPWQYGENWFRDTLVDADLASNVMGWQWTAGCGADAAPYFRVFNPVLQGEKFDREGEYVKRWVPELTDVPLKFVHKPWELDAELRQNLSYPEPLVDLKASRQRALDAFDKIKQPVRNQELQ